MLPLVRVNPGQFVKAGNLARDLHRQVAGVEARDPPNPACTVERRSAKCLVADAIRADHAHAGDDDSSFHAARVSFMDRVLKVAPSFMDHQKARNCLGDNRRDAYFDDTPYCTAGLS